MKNENGSAQIALIIFIVLTLIFGGATYSLFVAKEKAAKKDALQTAALKTEKDIVKEKEGLIIDLTDKNTDIQKELTDIGERLSDSTRALTETRTERDDAFKARDEAEELLDEEKTKFRTELDEIEKQLTQKRAAMETLEEEIAVKEETLEEKAADIRATAVEEIKVAKATLSESQQEINQLKSRLSHISADKEINFTNPEPDGKIVFADPENKFVIVNLSLNDGVVANMPFDVYESGTSSNTIKKGQIRIKQIKDDVSYAIIERLDNNLRPFIAGDLIGNPVFTRGIDTKKTFVLDGNFSTYNTVEITALIKSFGGKVGESVTVKTDFLVVGLEASMTAEAKRLHIPLMKEEQLYQYIQKGSGK